MSFQTRVNVELSFAVEGDFATSNPFASVPAPEAGFVAGNGGATIGRFAYIQDDGRTVSNTMDTDTRPFFIHRDQQGLVQEYLQEYSMNIPNGFPVTLMMRGDFYVRTVTEAAVVGDYVFASETDGSAKFNAADTPIAGFQLTPFRVTRGTDSTGELATISA